MVSDYLKQNRPLSELRYIVENHHQAGVAIAVSTFNQEVMAAISNITEINTVSSARIQADSQVASAKIASDAEVAAISISAHAEISVLDVQSRVAEANGDDSTLNENITEVCSAAHAEIRKAAQRSVDEIQTHAQNAIERITDSGRQAIQKIQLFVPNIEERMRTNEGFAQARLNKAFNDAESRQEQKSASIAKAASAEAKQLHDELASTLNQLSNHVQTAIKDINAITNTAISSMKRTVEGATEHIFAARDRAIEKVKNLKQRRSS